jgi:hypothetical protein
MGNRGRSLVPIDRDKRSVSHAKTPGKKPTTVSRTMLANVLAKHPKVGQGMEDGGHSIVKQFKCHRVTLLSISGDTRNAAC